MYARLLTIHTETKRIDEAAMLRRVSFRCARIKKDTSEPLFWLTEKQANASS